MLEKANFLLLDGARVDRLLEEAMTRNKAFVHVTAGVVSPIVIPVFPKLFQYANGAAFSNWYLKTGWGKSWGVMCKSQWPLSELGKHFQKLLLAGTPDKVVHYFRFYDPRVLRLYLPTCNAAELRQFFGDAIEYLIAEDADPQFALRFSHRNGELLTERLSVKELLDAVPEPEPLPEKQEQLPPETIAALKEAEERLKSGSELQESPAPPPQKAAVDKSPAAATETTPKPKTKWNMFD